MMATRKVYMEYLYTRKRTYGLLLVQQISTIQASVHDAELN